MTTQQAIFSPTSTDFANGFGGRSTVPATAYNAVVEPNDFVDCTFSVTNFGEIEETTSRLAAAVLVPACPDPNKATNDELKYLEVHAVLEADRPPVGITDISRSIEENLTKSNCAIDSMQIWIPVECRVIGKRQFEKVTPIKLIECDFDKTCLQDSWLKASTGEIVKERPAYLHNDKYLSFTTGYAFRHIIVGNQCVNFISIGLHSKLLGTDYFKSITLETIYKVWQSIIEQKVITITFENFLKCYVHQIDLKTDSIQDNVNASLDLIEANIREDRIYKRYNQKLNQGIQLGSRKDNQLSIHFYNKALQFLNDIKSSIFLEKVLKFEHPKNILRTEITIYAKQFFNDFEMTGERNFHPESQITLENVLTCVETKGKFVMKTYLTKAFKTQQVNKVKMKKIETLDDDLMDQIKFGVQLCITSSMTLEDTELAICKLLKPGINKKPKVLRLTRHFYTIETKTIDLDDNIKQAINF